MHRIFIAIDISEEVVRFAKKHADTLKQIQGLSRVSWVRTDKMHLTLRFLGDIEGEMLSRLNDFVSEVAAGTQSFVLTVSNPGAAPNKRRPKVLWFDIHDPTGTLQTLKHNLDESLHRLGFERETREFRPHLTIARLREPNRARTLAGNHLKTESEPIDFAVSQIAVVESRLMPSGSVYSRRFVADLC